MIQFLNEKIHLFSFLQKCGRVSNLPVYTPIPKSLHWFYVGGLISSSAVCNIQYRKRGAEIYPFFGIIVIEIDKPLQHESRYSDNKQEGDALHLGLLAGKGDKVIPQYIQIKKYRAKQPDQSVIKEE